MIEPLPDRGWSRERVRIRNALVVPATENKRKQECGVLDAHGDRFEAATWRDDKRLTQPVKVRPAPTERLAGRHVWGGMIFGHFGHFIAESLARFWAVRESGAQSVLFIPKHEALGEFIGYRAKFCSLLGIDIPVQVLTAPTEVEELVVPGQGFGLGKISCGTPEFRAMMRKMSEKIEADGPEKIYISRTKFSGKGGVVGEAVLEMNLQAAGYTVVHPQRMPIEKQFALYKAAKKVIGLDSSAFHILGFVARPEQLAAIVLRRNNYAFTNILNQLDAAMGHTPTIINALCADWMPEKQKSANHLSWGELDHVLLAAELEAAGFIDDSDAWKSPSDNSFRAALAAAEATSNTQLVRREVTERVVAINL